MEQPGCQFQPKTLGVSSGQVLFHKNASSPQQLLAQAPHAPRVENTGASDEAATFKFSPDNAGAGLGARSSRVDSRMHHLRCES